MFPARVGKTALKTFLATVASVGLLCALVTYTMYRQEAEAIESNLRSNGQVQLDLAGKSLRQELGTIFANLRVLSGHVEVHRFLTTPTRENRIDVEQEFLNMCRGTGTYDQIRLLDPRGMEVVRINNNGGTPAAVPLSRLQDKSDRNYFKRMKDLPGGKVYVSAFDLNIENGVIEQPPKPMIRVGTAVLDETGNLRGFVILNYLGQGLLDNISANMNRQTCRTMLLNEDGYWLLSHDKSQEWAFMYKNRQDVSFKNAFPREWNIINSSEKGLFSTDLGTYGFVTIPVSPQFQAEDGPGSERVWKLVCLQTASAFAAATRNTRQNYATLFAFAMVMTLLVAVTRASMAGSRARSRERLEQARQAAEDANTTKSDFLARMSHEIRTPMNAIIGMTHLVRKTDLTPKQQDYLEKIDYSAKALLGIINDILDFSKIEANKLAVETTDFQLDDVLNSVLNILGIQAEQKDIEFLLMVESSAPNLLVGDPLRLGQVLLNLAGNAVKFTDAGEVVITITTLELDEKRAVIRFSIRDTGVGISPEAVEKLFQPFNQADESISRQYGGTGLGLTISKHLTELMGGTLELESEPDKGSEFIVTIPFDLQERQTEGYLQCPKELKGLRVLVVDDSRISREVISNILKSFSFSTETAASGLEALDILTTPTPKGPVQLVFTDWKMPRMDGFQLVDRINNDPNITPKPKIVMLTAYGHDEVLKRAERVNLDGFMLKPFSRVMLYEAILNAFHMENHPTGDRREAPATQRPIEPNIAGARILLVEDNVINQQLGREILESSGAIVAIAGNGFDAIEMLRDGSHDAVLMDIQMPIMDGYQAVEIIRADLRLRDIPIIAMTAHALAGDREKSLIAGMNDHITKPIDPDALLEVLARWLPDRPATEARRTSETKPRPPDTNIPNALRDLPGFDVDKAIARFQGNTALYSKLLGDFARDCETTFPLLAKLIGVGEFGKAKELAHSSKGVAGNLGADSLFRSLQALEAALDTAPERAAEMLQAMEDERKRIVDIVLDAFPGPEARECVDRGIDLPAALELLPDLAALVELLRVHDAEARHLFAELEPRLLRAAPWMADELGVLLANFDFTEGRARIEEFITLCKSKEGADG
jgi:signal transduction histidine kinase/CheY-like chemotaxis protein/HPt (histidine-containing phosphotransfer) domain-containing protein